MELVSQCALRAEKVVWRPGHGGFAFTVVCKATFDLRPELSPLAAAQEAVTVADVPAGEHGGIAAASDLVPFKKRPEVLLTGHAHAPEGRPVTVLVARVAVGEIDKAIQVVGDRYFNLDGRLSEAVRFSRMPLVWERAVGGPETSNPAGMPLGEGARTDFFGRVTAPNLMAAGVMLAARSDSVAPVGFGPVAPRWPSRAGCLHQHAAEWDPGRWQERPLPADIDLAYFNAAPADQQRTLPFGEDTLYLECLHPLFAHLSTRLAPVSPVVTVDQGAGPQPLQLRCDTLLIDTDRGRAMLVWRGHLLLDHPDRAGRVLVTAPGAPPPRAPSFVADVTIAPVLSAASPALPFSGSSAPATPVPPSVRAGAVEPAPTADPGAPPERSGRSVATVPIFDEEVRRSLAGLAAALPFAQAAQAAQARQAAQPSDMTMIPGLPPGFLQASASATLPFSTLPGPSTPGREGGLADSASAVPFVAPAMDEHEPQIPRHASTPPPSGLQYAPAPAGLQYAPPPALDYSPPPRMEYAPPAMQAPAAAEYAPLATPAGESPARPGLLGAIAAASAERSGGPDRERPPAAEGAKPPAEGPAKEPEPQLAFEQYPPERCGVIAARLACDEPAAGDILQAETLDAAGWQRVHEHWLERIRDEAARSRKKLLADYDAAYVSALEAQRGPIALDDYARLAEAAERSAVAAALAERGLPAGAWPHIHRVWIGRTLKDMRVGKQVRNAIDALRAAS